jgi:hypothetical protein
MRAQFSVNGDIFKIIHQRNSVRVFTAGDWVMGTGVRSCGIRSSVGREGSQGLWAY